MELERDVLDDLLEAGLVPVNEPWWLGPEPAFELVITPTYVPARPLKTSWTCEQLPALVIGNALAVRPVFSESFIKTPVELKPYETPISELLISNSVKDLQEAEDARFLQMLLDSKT